MVQTKTAIKPSASSARPAAIAQPVRVGPWQLQSLLAEGRTAHVYAADAAGGRAAAAYALKLLRWPWDTDPRGLAMVGREACLGRQVSSPHVVPVLSASLAEAPFYTLMPRLDGQTAAQLLRAGVSLELPVALWIARQVAEGLCAIHAAGWIHGDVKPANVLVHPSGHATLIDLGFARPLGELVESADNELLGTPAYLAPELLVANCRTDQRSDLYSLGITLFELLAGSPPFTIGSPAELIEQHRTKSPKDLRAAAPNIPALAIRLVRELLSSEPLRRPQTARDVADRLASLEIATFAERCAA
jgi:eukaryotic-like serine/threonine-protein kinase